MNLESAFSDGYSLIEERNIVEEIMAGGVKVKFLFFPSHEDMYEDLRFSSTHS